MPVTAQVKFTIWLWHLCTIRCNPGRDFSQLHGSSVWLCYIHRVPLHHEAIRRSFKCSLPSYGYPVFPSADAHPRQ